MHEHELELVTDVMDTSGDIDGTVQEIAYYQCTDPNCGYSEPYDD